jgi:hypothetical protein
MDKLTNKHFAIAAYLEGTAMRYYLCNTTHKHYVMWAPEYLINNNLAIAIKIANKELAQQTIESWKSDPDKPITLYDTIVTSFEVVELDSLLPSTFIDRVY